MTFLEQHGEPEIMVMNLLLATVVASHDAHSHGAKHFSMSPPLPRDLGRNITGCFLEDERLCVGIADGMPAPKLIPPYLVARSWCHEESRAAFVVGGHLPRMLAVHALGARMCHFSTGAVH